MNLKIKRFCKLIVQINNIHTKLDKERDDFYYGGHSFEECYKSDLDDLRELENELLNIIKHINE